MLIAGAVVGVPVPTGQGGALMEVNVPTDIPSATAAASPLLARLLIRKIPRNAAREDRGRRSAFGPGAALRKPLPRSGRKHRKGSFGGGDKARHEGHGHFEPGRQGGQHQPDTPRMRKHHPPIGDEVQGVLLMMDW